MIQKINSKEIMDVLQKSQDSIKDIENNVATAKLELNKRLEVIKNEQEYSAQELANIKNMLADGARKSIDNKIVLVKSDIVSGAYEKFGCSIHPAFIKTPTNIFNFDTVAGAIFKDNANVKINDTVKESYKSILMHDSIVGKSVAFEEFDSPELTLEVAVNPDDLLGSTDFNIIEIMPFLPGSFSIERIQVFTMQDYKTNSMLPATEIINTIDDVGISRIMIDKTRTLYRCVFDIKLNFRNANGKYPFGLKHLYFLKGSYDPDSKIIVKKTTDNFIDWISEDITVVDQSGKIETTCTEEKVKLFMSYSGDVPSFEIATSKGLTQNSIARNIKEFFIQIPLVRSINSLRFKTIAER